MPYTIIHEGQLLIGTSRLEHRLPGRIRQGQLDINEAARELLPPIADMGPALLEFGKLARAQGLDPDADETFRRLLDTPEVKRIRASAKYHVDLCLVGPEGEFCPFDRIFIHDVADMRTMCVEHGAPGANELPEIPRGAAYVVDVRLSSAEKTAELRGIVQRVKAAQAASEEGRSRREVPVS